MKIRSFIQHIALFVVVEVLFVLLVFRELPTPGLFTVIGVGHLVYWLLIPCFGWLRERSHMVWQKFLATYTPIVLHVLLHVVVAAELLHEHGHHHGHHHAHDEHDFIWMVVGTLLAGVVIFVGEYLLHRTTHCDTHHHTTHKQCQKTGHGSCEHRHE